MERSDSPASRAVEAEALRGDRGRDDRGRSDRIRADESPGRRPPAGRARVPAPASPGRGLDPDGFDLRGWLRGPRHREAPGVYGFGRDEREIRLRAAERDARTRPEAALVRRAVLWLVIAIVSLNWVILAYVWLVRKILPEFLWPLLFNNLLYVLLFALFCYLGRWYEIAWPFLRPWWQRLDRRAESNGRPRPEQWRRAALFLVLGFVAWIVLMRPFVALLLLIIPRGALHDAQWLVRLVYNGGFVYAAAVLGRWRVVVEPYTRTPREHAAPEDEETPVDADLWPELREAGQHEAADVLDDEVAAGRLRDVDYLRLRRVIEAGDQDPEYLADVAEEIVDHGAAACRHGSGQRDVRPRRAEHDLLTGQVRIGAGTDHARNPALYRATDFALDPDVLGASMLVVGAARAGEPGRLLEPVVEAMSLRALTGTASLLVIDAKGDEFERPGGYDREVIVGDRDSPWGLDLYGGAGTPEDAADRLAAAALPPSALGLGEGASNALRQVLGAYVAGHERYPDVGTLLDLLDGTEAALVALEEALRAAGRYPEHERALRAMARGDDDARMLVQRLAVLERPGVAELFHADRERFGAGEIDRPLRVRIALNEAAHPEAARLIGRLVLAQFVQAMATPRRERGPRRVFACLVADDAGRLIDEYAAKGLQWARNRRAGLVLSVRSLDDLAPALRHGVFTAAGCKAIVPGASRADAELFAEHWGMTKEQERSITMGSPEGGLVKRLRYSVLGALFGEKASGRSERVTTRTVERYRWSPAELTSDLPAEHAVLSLTTRKGERTPPVLIDLGR
ncbi:hypothetical protein EHYA_04086 [Embleya hyalina]|uniref:Uncharacterized protein n=1 Tax=Embleya hyalina TaxID=516124 RepID=A0A401YP46_9ACTN|nr:hypothetical protein EHYA_04086 [Embleya hyalina]